MQCLGEGQHAANGAHGDQPSCTDCVYHTAMLHTSVRRNQLSPQLCLASHMVIITTIITSQLAVLGVDEDVPVTGRAGCYVVSSATGSNCSPQFLAGTLQPPWYNNEIFFIIILLVCAAVRVDTGSTTAQSSWHGRCSPLGTGQTGMWGCVSRPAASWWHSSAASHQHCW